MTTVYRAATSKTGSGARHRGMKTIEKKEVPAALLCYQKQKMVAYIQGNHFSLFFVIPVRRAIRITIQQIEIVLQILGFFDRATIHF